MEGDGDRGRGNKDRSGGKGSNHKRKPKSSPPSRLSDGNSKNSKKDNKKRKKETRIFAGAESKSGKLATPPQGQGAVKDDGDELSQRWSGRLLAERLDTTVAEIATAGLPRDPHPGHPSGSSRDPRCPPQPTAVTPELTAQTKPLWVLIATAAAWTPPNQQLSITGLPYQDLVITSALATAAAAGWSPPIPPPVHPAARHTSWYGPEGRPDEGGSQDARSDDEDNVTQHGANLRAEYQHPYGCARGDDVDRRWGAGILGGIPTGPEAVPHPWPQEDRQDMQEEDEDEENEEEATRMAAPSCDWERCACEGPCKWLASALPPAELALGIRV